MKWASRKPHSYLARRDEVQAHLAHRLQKMRTDLTLDLDRRPCLSPNDVILSINTRDAIHILTSYSSFILSHLFFNGNLRSARLFFLDLEMLMKKNKKAFAAASLAQSYHNVMMGFRNLP
ncbi:MAG: hypothetical protein NXI27_00885 [Alphaproteobacteria bacterium]|nr:hypothetical protein [Alphaproteobacteria bacterium]